MSLSHVHDPASSDPIILFLQGETNDAVGYMQRLVEKEPFAPLAHVGLAESLISAERFDEALSPARRVVGLLLSGPFVLDIYAELVFCVDDSVSYVSLELLRCHRR